MPWVHVFKDLSITWTNSMFQDFTECNNTWVDANANDLMMKWMHHWWRNGCIVHPIMQWVCICQSIENRIHPLLATGRSLVVVLRSSRGKHLGSWSPSSSQTDSLNMFLKVKERSKHPNKNKLLKCRLHYLKNAYLAVSLFHFASSLQKYVCMGWTCREEMRIGQKWKIIYKKIYIWFFFFFFKSRNGIKISCWS